MKINWKARFKNKTFVVTFLLAVVTFVYQLLSMFGVTAAISQDQVTNLIMLLVNLLVGLGIVVDPTTEGVSDSDRALTYYKESNK